MLPIGLPRPDMADTNPGVAKRTVNVILSKDQNGVSARPMPSLAVADSAGVLPAAPRGGTSVVTRAGGYLAYVATGTNIYNIGNDYTYTSYGSGYNCTSGDNWMATQFGNYAVFTNTTDGQVQLDIETPVAFAAISGAPKARSIAPIFDCMFAFDCDGDNRLMQNSDVNDHTDYEGGVAARQPMPDGEELITGGELNDGLAIVLQRNAVRLLTRTSDRQLYTMNKIADGIGAVNPQSVVTIRGACFFWDVAGPHMYLPGMPVPEHIGADKISRTFLENASGTVFDGIEGAYDPANQRIIWRYQAADVSSGTVFQDAITYDIRLGEFVECEFASAALLYMASPGYTLEGLDAVATLDALPYSLDSRVWYGGEPRLAGLNGDLKFGFFDGTNLAATCETATQMFPERMRFQSVRPITDAQNATVEIGTKAALYSSLTYSTAASIQPSGRVPVRAAGKNARFRISVAAGESWNYIRGIDDIEAVGDGAR